MVFTISRFTIDSSGTVSYTHLERMVRVARDLRSVHRFNGYIHLKSIPGASRDPSEYHRHLSYQW